MENLLAAPQEEVTEIAKEISILMLTKLQASALPLATSVQVAATLDYCAGLIYSQTLFSVLSQQKDLEMARTCLDMLKSLTLDRLSARGFN